MTHFPKAVFLIPVMALGVSSMAFADDAKREQAQENFLQADANSDKALNADEFRTFVDLNAEDEIGRMSKIKRMGLQDRAFKRVDADGNGFVTANEFAMITSQAKK